MKVKSTPYAVSRFTPRADNIRQPRHRSPVSDSGHANSDHAFAADEMEFLAAIEGFQLRTNRKFPMWTEVLWVLKSIGYSKPPHESHGENHDGGSGI